MYMLTFPEIQDLMKAGFTMSYRINEPIQAIAPKSFPFRCLPVFKIIYIGNFGYPLSVTFIKVALLFQYLRMFKDGSKSSLLCKCLIVIITIWGLAFYFFR